MEDTAEMTLETNVTGVMIFLTVHKAIEAIFTIPLYELYTAST